MERESAGQFLRATQGPGADNATPPPQVELSREAQHALAERVRAACSEWISQMGVVQRHEAEFGVRLARCRTPSEAVAVCGEWMAHRLDSAIVMHHRFLELWLTSATDTTNRAAGAKQRPTADETGPAT